jgi:alanine racemase
MILLDDLLAATGGQLHGPAGVIIFESFCFDSRVVRPGQLFIAVKTERADGHDYIAGACAGGAAGVLCQLPMDACATCIVVPDTRQAIQDWARFILAKQGVEVIGITGSVGKTTAKEAIAAVLAADAVQRPVFKNQANYNGLYGLSIALGELRPEHRIAVLEMAADHFGEISRLARIAPPSIAVVTTVEPAHLEAFGSLEAIAHEKGDLVAALPRTGLAVLNADDPRVLAMAERTNARVVTFGTCAGDETVGRVGNPSYTPADICPDIYATDILVTRDGTSFTVHTATGSRKVNITLLGRHQVYAALAATAVGLARGLTLETIVARLAELPRVPGRLNPLSGRRGSLLLDDSYSASPAAVEAALDTLAALDARHRIAVLGDMLELGEYEIAGHDRVGIRAAGVLDLLVTNLNDRPVLLRNDTPRAGRHWLMVDLVGREGESNRDAIGAIVTCRVTQPKGDSATLLRLRSASGSYMSVHDQRLHFGLGTANVVAELTVRWPDGSVQSLHDVKADQVLRLRRS